MTAVLINYNDLLQYFLSLKNKNSKSTTVVMWRGNAANKVFRDVLLGEICKDKRWTRFLGK